MDSVLSNMTSYESLARYSLYANYKTAEPDRIFSSEKESLIIRKCNKYNKDDYAIKCTGITYGVACNIY